MFFNRSNNLAGATAAAILAIATTAIGQQIQQSSSAGQWKSATSRSRTIVRPADESGAQSTPIRQASYTLLPYVTDTPSVAIDKTQTAAETKTAAPKPAIPPMPSTPAVDRYPGGSVVLRIPFSGTGLTRGSVAVADAFRVYYERPNAAGVATYERVLPDGTPDLLTSSLVVELRFRYLNPGVYWIVFSELQDSAGKMRAAGAVDAFKPDTETGEKKSFIVPEGQERGEQVEFPRFLRPGDKQDEFDPGDRVDTRVLQLYYFRDARLVAEYINRNIKDLNQAGYDEAQRFAQQARQTAEESIDERRFKETAAIEAARKTRELQHQLGDTRDKLADATQKKAAITIQKAQLENAIQVTTGADSTELQASIDATKSAINLNSNNITASSQNIDNLQNEFNQAVSDEKNAVPGAMDRRIAAEEKLSDAEASHASLIEERGKLQNKLVAMNSLQANLAVLQTAETQLTTDTTNLNTLLGSGALGLPNQLINSQTDEISERNAVVKAEALELRAAQEQFRREVAAGLADRNSYARGLLRSVDPVTQVSISVVGTSRLQLRGPIKGVNKIARMVHQLDSPVGQVKIGIHTIQVNGEHGDRMDFVYERINQEVAHSRFLVNMSSQLLRRAVQEVASEVALAADQGYLPDGCPPDLTTGFAKLSGTVQTTGEQRDRRYLYAFFGSDFISELEEMDSELLNTQNKLLSIHSMDTISLAGAFFVMAHADSPVRQRIVQRFQELLAGELPQRETEYVQSLTHVTSHGKTLQNRFRQAMKIDNKNAAEIYFNASRTYHFPNTVSYFSDQIPGQGTLNPVQYATIKLAQSLKAQLVAEMELRNYVLERSLLETKAGETAEKYAKSVKNAAMAAMRADKEAAVASHALASLLVHSADAILAGDKFAKLTSDNLSIAQAALQRMREVANLPNVSQEIIETAIAMSQKDDVAFKENVWDAALVSLGVDTSNDVLFIPMATALKQAKVPGSELWHQFREFRTQISLLVNAKLDEANAKKLRAENEESVFSQRLLDQFIDEQEEKSVELMEALRAHSSNVDNYLKRLAIAVEDDVAAQFYEPAFQRIRRVSRTWDVTLGQIETTTVLTNNRTLAKVSPAASFEFDLPQRDILLTEALNGSKALANEYGNLLKDGTFLAGTAMLSGQPATGILGDNAAIQGIPGLPQDRNFGSELQKLIPDPAIYKFETGTGFEIRPIIQPDGNSIVYGFDYMYSTNVREPVRADEKHLGRIKRHFVHTDVQTSSYELREISRYTVALKASRTDRGVPLFEDLPGVGAAFRPLPSEESSLQTNIILGSSTIYPTVFDLMGLRWSAYVDELSSPGIATDKTTQASRREELRSHLLNNTREKVNSRIRLSIPRKPSVNQITPSYLPNSRP